MARRILLFVTDLEIGGTPTVVRELAVRLNRPPDVTVEVACLARWGPVADELRAAGVAVTALNCTQSWQFLSAVWRLARLIRRGRFDTVFSFLVHANAVAAAAKPLCKGVRFVQSIQTTQPRPRWHWRVQRLAQRFCERVVVPSPSVRDAAAEWAGLDPARAQVIPNAVDPDAFPRSPVPAADPRPYPIGFIGRLDPIKRVPWLVSDFHVLEHLLPGQVHLHVFGDGPERASVEAQVDRHDLRGKVTMHGAVARPQEALAQLGLLVLRSQAEGFGLVLIEAMAAGVPVVATRVPGIRDVVREGATGLLCHPGSPIEVVTCMREVVLNADLRRRLVENGLHEVRARFSWQAVLPEYRRLLELP